MLMYLESGYYNIVWRLGHQHKDNKDSDREIIIV